MLAGLMEVKGYMTDIFYLLDGINDRDMEIEKIN